MSKTPKQKTNGSKSEWYEEIKARYVIVDVGRSKEGTKYDKPENKKPNINNGTDF